MVSHSLSCLGRLGHSVGRLPICLVGRFRPDPPHPPPTPSPKARGRPGLPSRPHPITFRAKLLPWGLGHVMWYVNANVLFKSLQERPSQQAQTSSNYFQSWVASLAHLNPVIYQKYSNAKVLLQSLQGLASPLNLIQLVSGLSFLPGETGEGPPWITIPKLIREQLL